MKYTLFRGGFNLARGLGIAVIAMFLVIGTGARLNAETRPVESATLSATAQAEAECAANGSATVARHSATGSVRFVGAAAGQALRAADASAATSEQAARSYLVACGSLFGLGDAHSNLSVMRESSDADGRSMVRYQQTHNGVPVLAGELIVNLNASRNVTSVSGELLPNIQVDTQPRIDAAAAQASALSQLTRYYGADAAGLIASEPTLWIYNPSLIRPGGGITRLTWRMELTHKDKMDIRALVLVDAKRGGVALHFNQIDFAKNRMTYDANNGTTLPGTLRCNESNPTCAGGDSHEVGAHKYAGQTYDFYLTNHGRDSIDGAGLTLISTVHYDVNYFNAFWDGDQMVYGDADTFPLADDVVAHELTHGVTQYESALFYYYESGAINEALSDIFGEFLDLTNGAGNDSAGVRWLLGEDLAGNGAIRDMKNPPAFGHPDKMTSSNYFMVNCGAFNDPFCDQGGVHSNSGVANKAAYLLVDGGSFNGKTVSALGIPKVAKIFYEVQTHLLTGGSDYGDLYLALFQGCQNLIGSGVTNAADCQEVRDATDATEMNKEPVAGYNTNAALCTSGSPNNLFFDNLESGSGNWTFGSVSGSSQWSYDYEFFYYPHSGQHFLHGADFNGENSDSFVAMNSSVALPANAYLHFAHAYGFEDPDWDGGILEYSTNGGGSWNNAGGLIEVNGYDGPLNAGNPLGAINAFRADSHGYISTRVNLSSLAGQSVRFRFRMGVDEMVFDVGWFVDDVRIYTCGSGTVGPVTVTQVRVTDENKVDQTEFNRGDEIRFRVKVNNAGSLACNISLRLKVRKDETVLFNRNKNITLNPGNKTVKFKETIPLDAPFLEYKAKATSNCNGQKDSAKDKFSVVP